MSTVHQKYIPRSKDPRTEILRQAYVARLAGGGVRIRDANQPLGFFWRIKPAKAKAAKAKPAKAKSRTRELVARMESTMDARRLRSEMATLRARTARAQMDALKARTRR